MTNFAEILGVCQRTIWRYENNEAKINHIVCRMLEIIEDKDIDFIEKHFIEN